MIFEIVQPRQLRTLLASAPILLAHAALGRLAARFARAYSTCSRK